MHQHPRPAPSSASPANSEQTNPYRSNNPRDPTPSTQASGSSEDFVTDRQPDTAASMQRLNQVVQNFHTKATLIILHSRADLSPAYSAKTNEIRVNKWFNIELDETDDYLEDIKQWKRIDIQQARPSPLIIEVYLTTEAIPKGQRLVILDDDQKRWDVYKALEPREARNTTRPEKSREILLERWTIQLGVQGQPIPSDLASVLPHVYKKSIVLFRALFTCCNLLPAHKLIRKLGKSRSTTGLKVGFRIVDGDRLDGIARADNLSTPLSGDGKSSDVTTDYSFGSTESPAGPFSIDVKYRSNCDFRVDDSEELFSSRFIGADDEIFRPRDERGQQIGSLPNDQRRHLTERPELGQAYGSMSTFHQAGVEPGTSPLSALRAQREYGSDSPSPQRQPIQQAQSTRPPAASRASTGRRSSFSFQPFKAPTLAASPLGSSPLAGSPRISTRVVPTLGSLKEEVIPQSADASSARKTSSTNTAPATSSSPKPAPVQRFQSSFGHRKNRLSVDRTTTKTDEDQTSSGKASASSSNQPGSGLMVDPTADGSSGSMQEDDENISDFLKMLDTKKDLLKPSSASAVEISARKTAAALSKFHKMRDENAALSESMSSSLMVPKSSTSSSRQLPAQTGTSTGSSPGGKPLSPHTPHTPFAPSRLSAAYSHDEVEPTSSSEEKQVPAADAPGAIDIPNSPRLPMPGYRRSSSAARRPPSSEDDIADLYGMRSASMGANTTRRPATTAEPQPFQLDEHREKEPESQIGGQDGAISDSASGRSSLPTAYRSRFARGGATRGGSHTSPGQGSVSSIGATGASVERAGDSESVSGSWGRGGRQQGSLRPDAKVGDDEDELPFVFDASTFISGRGGETKKEGLTRK